MFKREYLLNLINIYSKFWGLLLLIISLFLLNNKVLVILLSLILVIITIKRRHVIVFSLLSLLFSILSLIIPHILWIPKLCIFIIYLIYLSDIVDIVNVKKLYEGSLYKYKNYSLMRFFISIIYFLSIFKKNFRKMDKPRKEYGVVTRFGYFIKLFIKCFSVSKSDLKNIILYHRLRFYNIETRRESIDKIETRKNDYYYVGFHILFLIICLIMRFV